MLEPVEGKASERSSTSLLLTSRELETLMRAARGCSDKLIAYELGVKESTAKTWLRRGRLKLGGAERSALTSALSGLNGPQPSAPRDITHPRFDALTPTEREVLALLLDGASDVGIAKARGRSARTIANQVAAIYRKLGVRCRRELWATMTSSYPP